MPRLIITSESGEQTLELPEGRPVFLGRASECDIHIPLPAVSRRHAAFILKNGICAVKDLDSFNGTYLNNRRLEKAEELKLGDRLEISSIAIVYTDADESEAVPESEEEQAPGEGPRRSPRTSAGLYPRSNLPLPRAMTQSPHASSLFADMAPPAEAEAASSGAEETQAAFSTPLRRGTTKKKGPPASPETSTNREDAEPDSESTHLFEDGPQQPEATPSTSEVEADDLDFASDVMEPPSESLGEESENDDDSSESIPAMPPPSPGDQADEEALRAAVETRLSLYSLLADLAEERKLFRLQNSISVEAEAELLRQESELNNMPEPEGAEQLILELRERNAALDREIRLALEAGGIPPPQPDRQLRGAEELGLSQWQLFRESGLTAFPVVLREAYRTAGDEPLVSELSTAQIDHGDFFGGAAYYLILESMLKKAKKDRRVIERSIQAIEEGDADGGSGSVFGKLGQMASNLKNRTRNREEAARLERKRQTAIDHSSALVREMAYVEKLLTREFWRVYTEAALHFIPAGKPLPLAVRAFLRYGAISFRPEWLQDPVREHIIRDCRNNVLTRLATGQNATHIVYADEYLTAVCKKECPPSPDEVLLRSGRGTAKWKADRAYRRIVNSHSYILLLREALDDIATRTNRLSASMSRLASGLSSFTSRSSPFRDGQAQRESELEILSIRRGNLERHGQYIENELTPSIRETISEDERRFQEGVLAMPTPEGLLRRECRHLAETSARMGGKRESFLPLALRGCSSWNDEAFNHREGIEKDVAAIEERDPGLFLHTVIASKKKITRVTIRMSPVIVIVPTSGARCFCISPREGMSSGLLALPLRFSQYGMRNKQFINMFADFRWESSKRTAGLDVMSSDTLAGAFMKLRWEWRNLPKERRERGLVFNELSDMANWRRVYELILMDSNEGGKRLFSRNPECYNALMGVYFDLPEGVELLRP